MTQTLAPNDTFDDGTPVYGAQLCGYIRYQPWTSDAGSGYTIPTATNYDLHNGYGSNLTGPAAFTATVADTFCGAVWRPYFGTDARASITITLDQVLGSAAADTFRYAAVCGRAAGLASYNDSSTGGQRMIAGDAYWFVLANNVAVNAAQFFYLLLRVKSGIVTQLAANAGTAPSTLPGLLASPFTMSMQITTVAGNPNILCSAGGVNQILFTDTDAAKLTATGRWGFGMCRDRQESGGTIKSVTLASSFQIDDIPSTTTVHRDEWIRSAAIGSPVNNDGNGPYPGPGRDLMCGWLGDVHSNGGNNNFWARDPGNNRVTITSGNSGTIAVSGRPGTNLYSARKSCTFLFSGTIPAGVNYCGVFVRCVYATPVNGYFMWLVIGVGPTWTLNLGYSVQTSNAALIIASANVAAISGVGLNSNITLDVQVINIGPGSPTSGAPTISCRVNSIKIGDLGNPVWVPGALAGSFTINANGDVVDNRTALGGAVQSGNAEGWALHRGDTVFVCTADTWTELTPAIPNGQAHVSQSLLEGFGKLALQPAHFQPVPHAAVSQSLLELFIDVSLSAHVSQSLIEGFYDTALKNARVSQSLLEMFIDQGPASNFLEDACIAIGSTGPGCERVSAVGAGVQMLGASGGGVERLSVARAGVAAIGCAGPGVERLGVRCP